MTETPSRAPRGELLICDCEGTMALDGKAIGKALGCSAPDVHHHLCRKGIEEFERVAAKATDDGFPITIACTQEAPLFLELLDELPALPPTRFVNIRETAGWSDQGKDATPKIAALLAEAAIEAPGARTVPLSSDGRALVLAEGPDGAEAALAAAGRLCGTLDVTVLMDRPGDDVTPPGIMEFAIYRGHVAKAEGCLGSFRIECDDAAPAVVSSRDHLSFADGRAHTFETDLIVDLRKSPAPFPAWQKRDGYFRADVGDPARVARVLMDASAVVGEFEKPLYVDYTESKCAHSRSRITGCTRCIDLCPTGAIQPAGDHVAIDPGICAGCGNCAAVCPTGAASYALPDDKTLFSRLRQVLTTYQAAGGRRPVLLAHGMEYGGEVIDTMARLGRGLPANVIPFQLNAITQVGMEFMLAAFAFGAERVFCLGRPDETDETAGLRTAMDLAGTVLGGLGYSGSRFAILDDADPATIGEALYGLAPLPGVPGADFLAMDRKRGILALALDHLKAHAPKPADIIELPRGAAFGAIAVNTAGCTLCLSCVGSCPVGALKDNPDKPQISFQETACVQCGLCRATCPEKVITLVPRINLTEAARRHQVLKEEDPFTCVRCGKPFGTRATIEKMLEKLASHPMFTGGQSLDRLKMCDNCRVLDMAEGGGDPLGVAGTRTTRTTEDYLRERDELRRQAADAMKDGNGKG